MPQIAVQMVTYNSASVLPMALQSLRNQTFSDFSVLIIDNGSADDSAQIAEAEHLRCVRNTHNIGYAAAHNQALVLTDSAYVLTLNPDVRLDPGFLAAMVEALEAHPEAGSGAGALRRVDDLADPQSENTTRIDGAGLFMRRNRRQGLLYEGASSDALPTVITPIFGVDGAAAFYRRAMLLDVSIKGEVFDPDFFMHKEDVDLSWRARLRGWECLFVPDARGSHVRSFRPGKRAGVSSEIRRMAARNRYLLMLKNEIGAHFWFDLLWIAAYELGILGYMVLRERSSLNAYGELWRMRRRMLAKRRLIQSRRRVGWTEMRRWFR